MALPHRALPCRALPCRVLSLIREYSQPMTRPDWRQSKPIITTYRLYEYILLHRLVNPLNNIYNTLYQLTFWRIIDTDWYNAYEFIRFYGLQYYLHMGGKHNLNDDGIQYAIDYYNKYRM
jgi:hypothetical protein